MIVEVHLHHQSSPVLHEKVKNAYQKGDLYCVLMKEQLTVYKYPISAIFRIVEKL